MIKEIEVEEERFVATKQKIKVKKYETRDGKIFDGKALALRYEYILAEKELLSQFSFVLLDDDEEWYFLKNKQDWEKIKNFYKFNFNRDDEWDNTEKFPVFCRWYLEENNNGKDWWHVKYIFPETIEGFMKLLTSNKEDNYV